MICPTLSGADRWNTKLPPGPFGVPVPNSTSLPLWQIGGVSLTPQSNKCMRPSHGPDVHGHAGSDCPLTTVEPAVAPSRPMIPIGVRVGVWVGVLVGVRV